jgi:DNA-binding GntR family transcriptional regulator
MCGRTFVSFYRTDFLIKCSPIRQFHKVLQQLQAVHNSKFLEIEIVTADAEVFNNVGVDAARHVAGMPCKGDEAVGRNGFE